MSHCNSYSYRLSRCQASDAMDRALGCVLFHFVLTVTNGGCGIIPVLQMKGRRLREDKQPARVSHGGRVGVPGFKLRPCASGANAFPQKRRSDSQR